MRKSIYVAMMAFAAACFCPQNADAQFFKQLGKAAEKVGKNVLNATLDTVGLKKNNSQVGKSVQRAGNNAVEQVGTDQVRRPTQTAAKTAQATTDVNGVKIVTGHPDFKISVNRCEAADKTVVLELIVLNKGENDIERFQVCGGRYDTKIYDDQGNVYEGETVSVKLANKEYTDWNTDIKLVAGVPTKLTYMIKGVSLKASSIVLADLNINVKDWSIGKGTVKLRNIPITRE